MISFREVVSGQTTQSITLKFQYIVCKVNKTNWLDFGNAYFKIKNAYLKKFKKHKFVHFLATARDRAKRTKFGDHM